MSTATLPRYANVSQDTIRAICNRFHCPACYARGFRLLANHGQIRGEQFRALIRTPLGKRVIHAICAELSKGLDLRFPPPEYQPPADYRYYA